MLYQLLQTHTAQAVADLYNTQIAPETVVINQTDPKFEGDFTVVVFPIIKLVKKAPQEVAQAIGSYLQSKLPQVLARFNSVQGFCNFTLTDAYWADFLKQALAAPFAGLAPKNKTVTVEYSSPNTNKPLHLGHIRNNLLGFSLSQILKSAGYKVHKVQIINDRGVHICKSMLAWEWYGNGETPESSNIKPDHLVGKYYVIFEQKFQAEYKDWQTSETAQQLFAAWSADEKNVKKANAELEKAYKKALEKAEKEGEDVKNVAAPSLSKYYFGDIYKNTYFNEHSTLGKAVKKMLLDWEAGDAQVLALWEKMNNWVYAGFEQTYQRLGVNFDKLYYESQTYLVGKDLVEKSLAQTDSIFYTQADGSVWIDLSAAKLDQKAVLRNDGTSMYITQDLGTACLRFEDFGMDKMVYVVGNEQEYHFKVLFEILKRLGYKFANQCYHLSYGMVNLPSGRMKSREGTVVDADDLIQELTNLVRKESEERATLQSESAEKQAQIWEQVGVAALKFYILKVEPAKTMVFDPEQSIDLQGQTGAYIQNAYVRTCGIKRKQKDLAIDYLNVDTTAYPLLEAEKTLLQIVHQLPACIDTAAETSNPAEIANYLYELARAFHRFYNDVVVVDKNNSLATCFRLQLTDVVAHTLQYASALLGMEMPERM